MLIISRRYHESFYVGDNVKVTILPGGHGGQVRIGILAPKEIALHREEVFNRIKAEGIKS
jgi:carbon storage regulator